MKRIALLASLVAMAGFAVNAVAEYRDVGPGAYAVMWREFSKRERSFYIAGAITGMLAMCYETIMGSGEKSDECDSNFKTFAKNDKNIRELNELLDYCYLQSQCTNLTIYAIMSFWYGEKDVSLSEKRAALKLISDDPKLFPKK